MDLHFVDADTTTASRHEKELKDSACKSHAARFVHSQNRRNQQHGRDALLRESSDHHRLDKAPLTNETQSETYQPRVGRLFFFGGNSDPFDSRLVPVNPYTNAAVSFAEHFFIRVWLPAFSLRLESSLNRPNCSIGLGVAHFKRNLHVSNEVIWWGVISLAASVMGQFVSDPTQLAEIAQMKRIVGAQTLPQLRGLITDLAVSDKHCIAVAALTTFLFAECCFAGDVSGAHMHSSAVSFMFKKFSGTTFGRMARPYIWSDILSAILQFRRPALDYELQIPRMMEPLWLSAESTFPLLSKPPQTFACVQSEQIQSALSFAWTSTLLIDSAQDLDADAAELRFHWITTKAEYHIGRLLNLYFDLIQRNSEHSIGVQHTKAAFTLALLYVVHKSFCDTTATNETDYHKSAGVLCRPLANELMLAEAFVSDRERKNYAVVFPWIEATLAFCKQDFGLTSNDVRRKQLKQICPVSNSRQLLCEKLFAINE